MDGTALWESRIHLSHTEILPLSKTGERLCFEGYALPAALPLQVV